MKHPGSIRRPALRGLFRQLPLAVQLGLAPLLAGAAGAALSAAASRLDGGALPWLVGGGLLGTLALWAALALHARMRGALEALQTMVDATAAGNLTCDAQVGGADAFARLGTSVEAMTRRFSQLVSGIRSEGQLVAMAGDRMAADAQAMSERTESQAASLEQTSASVSELSDTVQRNAGDAQAADALAHQVRAVADRGAAVVTDAVSAIQSLEQRSARMKEIVGTIDGIAFQTNILALNAAVEAARAGESGRGFAVVAAEVRTLAQRSAAAATEVRQLIDRSTQDIQVSATRVMNVSRSLDEVIQGVHQVARRVETIAASSTGQSHSLQEIAQAVSGLDGITQDNAAMVEAGVQSAARLREQARQLVSSVITMRLRQGCADEARALVERAVALIRQEGLAAAVRRFHDRQGGFVDRDLFIIVLDRQGWFRAFGADPGKADKPSVAAPGVDVRELVRMTHETADAGGGWIEFRAPHPVTQLPVDKMSYVLPVDAELTVMCSVNKSDGNPGRAPAAAAAATAPAVPQPA